jgi:CGNR zinc finger protein
MKRARRTNEAEAMARLLAFAQARSGEEAGKRFAALRSMLPVFAHRRGFLAHFPELEMPDRDRLQYQLRDSLVAFVDPNRFTDPGRSAWWEVPREVGPLMITDLQVHRGNGRTFPYTAGPWPVAFWFAIAAVIESGSPYLRRCTGVECGKLFVRTKRQAYCSKACGQRTRSRRFYEAHREEVSEQRHEQYKARVRKALKNPKAKVRRRARPA